jgi:Helix-turn-helix domain
MSRYRLSPTPAQEAALLGHCAQARYVWNLAVEQRGCWQPGRGSTPGFALQCRLTRAERGSTRRGQVKRAVARLHARAADRRTKSAKGTVERPGKRVRQKAGLNRGILGCVACAWTGNADVNAARNIAAGRAVPARGGPGWPRPMNREPHHVASSVA